MSAATYVGRVGGLAVALGVGAAVVTGYGCGVAWADTLDSSPSKPSSTSESSTNASSSDSTEAAKDTGTAPTEPTTGSKATSTSTGSTTPQAPTGVVVSTGGANTSSSSKDDEERRRRRKIPPSKGRPARVGSPPPSPESQPTQPLSPPAPRCGSAKVDTVGQVDAIEVKVDAIAADPQVGAGPCPSSSWLEPCRRPRRCEPPR